MSMRFRALMTAICLLATISLKAQAPVALPDSVLYIAAPDLNRSWMSLQTAPLFAPVLNAWTRAAATPESPVAALNNARAGMEASVGFPTNTASLFSSVIRAAAISMAGSANETPTLLLSLQLSDPAKFDKMLEYLLGQMQKKNGATSQTVRRDTYRDSTIISYDDGENEAFLARRDSIFVLSNARPVIEQFLAGDASLVSVPLAAQKGMSHLKTQKGMDLLFFANLQQAATTLSSAGLEKLAPVDLSGKGTRQVTAALALQGENLGVEYALDLTDQARTLYLAKQSTAKPGQLPPLVYVPNTTWFISAQNNLDLPTAVAQLRKQSAAGGPTVQAQVDQIFDNASKIFGMSIDKDLLPAFGSNFVFAINDFQLNPAQPTIPSSDIFMAIEVKDATKVQQAIQMFERAVQAQMEQMVKARMSASATPAAVATPTPNNAPPTPTPFAMPNLILLENYKGVQLHTFALGIIFPPAGSAISPSWCIDGNYLLINISKDNLKKALETKSGGIPSFLTGPVMGELKSKLNLTEGNQFHYENFAAMAPFGATIKQFMMMRAGSMPPGQQILMDMVGQMANSLKYSAGTSRFTGEDVRGMAILAMNKAGR